MRAEDSMHGQTPVSSKASGVGDASRATVAAPGGVATADAELAQRIEKANLTTEITEITESTESTEEAGTRMNANGTDSPRQNSARTNSSVLSVADNHRSRPSPADVTPPTARLSTHGGLRNSTALGIIGVIAFLLLWELAARLIWRDPQVLPAPTQALGSAWKHLTFGELAAHIGFSLSRIVIGFAIAAVAGIALGVAAGWYAWFGRAIRPIVDLLRPIPPLAWIPIAIVWLGLGESSKWFVIFLGAFFPIFTNAHRGMASIPPVLLRAARTMDVDGPALLVKVALPAALPDIATGLRVGFGLAFGILVAAELIAAERGMGYLVMQSRQLGELGVAIFGILLIGVVSLISDAALGAALKRVVGRGLRTTP